jgi:hypothetical protein
MFAPKGSQSLRRSTSCCTPSGRRSRRRSIQEAEIKAASGKLVAPDELLDALDADQRSRIMIEPAQPSDERWVCQS